MRQTTHNVDGPGRDCPRRSRPGGGASALVAVLVFGSALAVVSGCAQKPGAILEPGPDAPVFPPPPDEPRIGYLGSLGTEADLKPGRGLFRRIGRGLFGGDEPRGMLSPVGVCTDGADRVFVADGNSRVVHVFDLESRVYARWRPPEEIDRFEFPIHVAYDPRGRLLVSDSVAGAIFVFDGDGGFLGTLGDGTLNRPVGMAIDPTSGDVYVADAGAHQVVVLSRSDDVVATIGERGSEPGQFNFPTYVALGAERRLYVSDSLNFRVQVFDAAGEPIRQIGSKGDMPGYFAQPKGIALDEQERLYVVDANFEAVQLFDRDGSLLMTFGHEGAGAGEFWLPVGIDAGPNARIWVADSYNRRVQAFELLSEEPER